MERGRPARNKSHEAGETPALQGSSTLKVEEDSPFRQSALLFPSPLGGG
jgi:hypothetical protein